MVYTRYLPIDDPQSLVDLDIPQPNNPASGHDLLVAIKAISVNPVDTKVRRGLIPITVQIEENIPCILGWDAAGEVIEVWFRLHNYLRKGMLYIMPAAFLDH